MHRCICSFNHSITEMKGSESDNWYSGSATAPSAGRAVASSIISPPPRIAVMGIRGGGQLLNLTKTYVKGISSVQYDKQGCQVLLHFDFDRNFTL